MICSVPESASLGFLSPKINCRPVAKEKHSANVSRRSEATTCTLADTDKIYEADFRIKILAIQMRCTVTEQAQLPSPSLGSPENSDTRPQCELTRRCPHVSKTPPWAEQSSVQGLNRLTSNNDSNLRGFSCILIFFFFYHLQMFLVYISSICQHE